MSTGASFRPQLTPPIDTVITAAVDVGISESMMRRFNRCDQKGFDAGKIEGRNEG